jgi:hypothetical protein
VRRICAFAGERYLKQVKSSIRRESSEFLGRNGGAVSVEGPAVLKDAAVASVSMFVFQVRWEQIVAYLCFCLEQYSERVESI